MRPGEESAQAAFEAERERLFHLAYRMLGTVEDAEDVLQDAWISWRGAPHQEIDRPPAYLTTVVTRLALDRLRSARARRERYVGPWLPEPLPFPQRPADVSGGGAPGPTRASAGGPVGGGAGAGSGHGWRPFGEDALSPGGDPALLRESLRMAFLVVLESLSPAERAAFLLHDVFGYGYRELAEVLERSEAACRQLASRARRRVRERRPRFEADPDAAEDAAGRFLEAVTSGDPEELVALLAPDVTVVSDGGGEVPAALRPVSGPERVARLLLGLARKGGSELEVRRTMLNGAPGAVIRDRDGSPVVAVALDVLEGQVVRVHLVRHPGKLARLPRG